MEKPKEQKNEWENIYGETEVEFGPDGKVKITERKSGETTEPQPVEKTPGQIAFEKLNEFGKRRVQMELKKFEESKEAQTYSPREFNEEIEQRREKLSKQMLELQK